MAKPYLLRLVQVIWVGAAVQEMLKHPSDINIKMLARKAQRTKKSLRI